MSFPKLGFVLAPRAERDIEDILAYSVNEWGEPTAVRYVRDIGRGIDRLRVNPLLGSERPELGRDLRGLLVGQHRIIYRVEPNMIRVLRVIHQRRIEFDL